MSEAGEFFRAREAAIAASQTPLDPGSVAVIDRTARRLHRRDAGLKWSASIAAAGVLAVGVVAALQFGFDQDPLAPSPSPSPSLSATPSPSATPTESGPEPQLIEGFAPVPHLPAEEIPWNQVGPGWFTVSYAQPIDLPALEPEQAVEIPQRQGGVSLVAPDGTWYASQTLEGLGVGTPSGWDGDALYLATRIEWGPEAGWYDFAIYDLASGQLLGSEAEVPWETSVGVAPGQSLSWAYAGDGLGNVGFGGARPACRMLARGYGVLGLGGRRYVVLVLALLWRPLGVLWPRCEQL